ncbi:MAG: hypothetical protein UY23_C0002G0019 [Candidatus Jorgensenbacteria bacterium GW2011_GWA1_48_11]|uniref:Alpha/beta hydrolase n=1 Tax=Candidatus Jorgensenbacteria bacterium GW2011_GWA1_48_11 TaxID=1618660 RepID=A0A0G1XAB0_9BACT|nr:MAG: hypothetical protein UY23_C0002G0019 [Candidatus Jorgensenbacteria bacterium GW2011_GWA1_48_11]KKW12718.1 MAG: hypothetical protein UY51_C0001G0018 [Candidatus Jorgensenbacteria bacterium GW2011_GWB1_49_9]
MKTAIILHGKPSKKDYFSSRVPAESNKHWLPWLQKQLILKGILAQAPELPEPYKPNYEKWQSVFEQFKIDKNTMLIGHSCGAGFLVRWLSEHKTKVGKVALVAPWIDPDRTSKMSFFNFRIDPDLIKRTGGLTIFVSKNDYRDIVESAKKLKNTLKGHLKIKEFANRGHFTFDDMKTDRFPELLNALLK